MANLSRALRYLGQYLLALLALALITFCLLRLLPGGPFDRATPLSPELRAAAEARYGLNESTPRQLGRYLGGLARGDLGLSYRYEGETVRDVLARGGGVSAFLGLAALFCALLLGVPVGVLAAARRGGGLDLAFRLAAVGAMSLPSYFTAALLIYIFSERLGWLPPALWGGPLHRVLPVFALALLPAAQTARLVRAAVLEDLRADFVRTARAKGAGERRALWRHAFVAALFPLLTLLGPLAANLVAGTFVVETVFALPGLGALFVSSIANRDYPVVMALTLLYGAVLLALNTATELAARRGDPRLGANEEKRR